MTAECKHGFDKVQNPNKYQRKDWNEIETKEMKNIYALKRERK